MAAFAQTAVTGLVTSPAGIANFTRNILFSLESQISKEMYDRQNAAFAVGGHQLHGGHKWKPLSPNTVALKARLGYPRPAAPLVRSGLMSQNQRVVVKLSLIGNGIKFQVFAVNRTPYSKYHDSGFTNHWSGTFVPRRAPVELTRADLEWIVTLLRGYMGPDKPAASRSPKTIPPKGTGQKVGLLSRVAGFFGGLRGRIGRLFGR